MKIPVPAGALSHGAVRAAVLAATLAVAACFGAAASFAGTPQEPASQAGPR